MSVLRNEALIQPQRGAIIQYAARMRDASMGVETALLFCAIRLTETLGTVSFSRDTRAAYETTLCLKLEELNPGLLTLCLTSHALLYFDATLNQPTLGPWELQYGRVPESEA